MANIIFICQKVDKNDPVIAAIVRWIEEFARHPRIDKMTVLALTKGEFNLPENAAVIAIKGKNDLATLFNFYREVFKRIRETDYFFVHMGGPYPLLLLPFRIFWRKPVYQWKTRTQITPMMNFYARFCDTKVFTASPTSFPLKLKKVKVVGHGIDTEQFKPMGALKETDLITVGRVAPVKQIEKAITAICGSGHTLNIYGPVLETDVGYKKQLDQLVKDLDLENQVVFKGPVRHDQLPEILSRHRAMVSFNKGGLDKAVLEAMACGLPVVTQNPCVLEILPDDLRFDNVQQALSLDDNQLRTVGERLRSVVEQNHNVKKLVACIMAEV